MRLIDADMLKKYMINNSSDVERFLQYIDEQPTIQKEKSEWIPCSERLPEDDQTVMVDIGDEYGGARYLFARYVIDGRMEYWQNANTGFRILCNVNAWKPLSEPYKKNIKHGERLKTCPFCSGRATFELVTAEMHNGVSEYRLRVECRGCGIHSGKSYVVRKKFQDGTFITIEDERDKAAEEWNRRNAKQLIDADKVVDALKDVSYERYENAGMGGEQIVNLDDAIEIVKGGGRNECK